jgi:hypothetical protein
MKDKSFEPTQFRWSKMDFVVMDGESLLMSSMQVIASTSAQWVIIRRRKGPRLYAFRPEELLNWRSARSVIYRAAFGKKATLGGYLGLRDDDESPQVQDELPTIALRRGRLLTSLAVSASRYIAVDDTHEPRSVGTRNWAFGSIETRTPSPPFERSPQYPTQTDIGTIEGSGPPMEENMVGPSISDIDPISTDLPIPRSSPAATDSPMPLPHIRERPSAEEASVESAPLDEVEAKFSSRSDDDNIHFDRNPTTDWLAAARKMEPSLDEGSAPTRYPSIGVDHDLLWRGEEFSITVDLLRESDPNIIGGPINVGTLNADWSTADLTVYLQCALFEFVDNPEAVITIRRNSASIPAKFRARARADNQETTVPLIATFLRGTRFCGSAIRMIDLKPTGLNAGDLSALGRGTVVVEMKAKAPDVTIHISKIDNNPARLQWLVTTERFDELPPQLKADIYLDRDPSSDASALFKEFAVLERGKHMRRIESFGSRLWLLAPEMFRKVYWALWDRYQRPLTIQFISDEPHIPWELLRPTRADESEIHSPLAHKHSVARWITRYDGYMRNALPAGRICTIAPKYRNASRSLPRAQAEADKLVADFNAIRCPGTRDEVLNLLENESPAEPVSILHFAGHGKFAPDAVTNSSIKLEDGDLAAAEVESPDVCLGQACRTLVFFNACEVGAAGAIFGEVGGWADAFLSRKFGGFIAPLWSVDDEDAGVVAAELLDRIMNKHQPIAEALRAIREAHGPTSPTFYSYLFYGDATAMLG